ncbi:MAG: sulfite exporter TauE/SafE family protein [Rhodospirillales bacterium]|nr:sulfite exporter TauE/SafE family protein [Rhodospirillales bacterium]
MPIDLLYVVLSACVGLIVGLTGVGGGSLMTPALVLLFNIHPATAVGTDLLYAAMTKSAGTLVHALRSNVAWRVVGLLSAGSVPAAIATLVALSRLGPHNGLTAKTITIVLGFALLLTSLLLVFRRWLLAMLLSLLVGSIPGIVVGSYLAPRAGERSLRYILALALMVAGGRLAAS